jgi:hypothetical protein
VDWHKLPAAELGPTVIICILECFCHIKYIASQPGLADGLTGIIKGFGLEFSGEARQM